MDIRQRFATAARAERPDLALLCLLIEAQAAGPARSGAEVDREIDQAQITLDDLAGELPYLHQASPERWATVLADLLGGRFGFHGVPADYERLDSSLLGAVLRRRRGLPILLSVVWLEVARRAGAPVFGVALPGHFVVGLGDPTGEHVLADPFAAGRLLTDGDVATLVERATGERLTPGALPTPQPADTLDIVRRILANIRAWAGDRPDRSEVRLWAVDLALLLPRHPAELRQERARLLIQRGDFLGGARELESYAEVVAAVDGEAARELRRLARAARARLN